MKLLFDQNLSEKLVESLKHNFPGSAHVKSAGLSAASDDVVWVYARDHGFAIVTRDADFHERSILEGFPPKIIWVRRGNCSTAVIHELLQSNCDIIGEFDRDERASTLILY